MPGIRELPSVSCPNWANNRDFLTSAEDRCSGNLRGEPAAELGAPSAIAMRSIGISKNGDPAPVHPVPTRVGGMCELWPPQKNNAAPNLRCIFRRKFGAKRRVEISRPHGI